MLRSLRSRSIAPWIGWVVAALVATSGLPATGLAASVDFFIDPSDMGVNAGDFKLAPGPNSRLPLYADPTAAGGGGIYGLSALLETFGLVSVIGFNCTADNCVVGNPRNPASQILFAGGDQINGEAAIFRIGDVSLDVMGAGGLQLTGGGTVTFDFMDFDLDPDAIAIAEVPEPGLVLLLGFGFGALLLARRRIA